ncbi:unnamed protein product [Arctogadus glacialis]
MSTPPLCTSVWSGGREFPLFLWSPGLDGQVSCFTGGSQRETRYDSSPRSCKKHSTREEWTASGPDVDRLRSTSFKPQRRYPEPPRSTPSTPTPRDTGDS